MQSAKETRGLDCPFRRMLWVPCPQNYPRTLVAVKAVAAISEAPPEMPFSRQRSKSHCGTRSAKGLHAPERLQTIEMGQVKKRIDIQVQRNSHVIHNCNSPHHPLASRSRNELHHGRHYPCLAGDCAGVGVGQLHFRTQIASREMALSNTRERFEAAGCWP
jgi:hypothetical protein